MDIVVLVVVVFYDSFWVAPKKYIKVLLQLDFLHPDLSGHVEGKQWKQMQARDNTKPDQKFEEGEVYPNISLLQENGYQESYRKSLDRCHIRYNLLMEE